METTHGPLTDEFVRKLAEIRNHGEAKLLELRIECMRTETAIRRLLREQPIDAKAYGELVGRLAASKAKVLGVVAATFRAEDALARTAGVKLRYDPNPAPMMAYEGGGSVSYAPSGSGGGAGPAMGWVCEPVGGDVIYAVCTDLSNSWYWQVQYTDGTTSQHVETLPISP